MNLKDIKIEVESKHGLRYLPTNAQVASSLIKRGRAIWIVKNKKIKITQSVYDWKELKNSIIKEENRLCYICGEFIPENKPATVDHIIPRSKFGKDERENLHCCCKRCNDDKLDMTLYDYYVHVKYTKFKDNTRYPYLDVDKLKELVRVNSK